MSAKSARTECRLALHLDSKGRVWFSDRLQAVRETHQSVDGFLKSAEALQATEFRILGTPGNALLILRLHEAQPLGGGFQKIFVGSPAVCPTSKDRERPELALQLQQRLETVPPSLGGWHEVTEHDLCHYRLIVAIRSKDPTRIKQAREAHPAWKPLLFLPGLDHDKAGEMLAELVDPRWFGDQGKPDSFKKLTAYMGISPRNLKWILGREGSATYNIERAQLVCGAIFNTPRPPAELITGNARYFLWRTRGDTTKLSGFRSACNRFLNYVRQTWLHQMAPKNRHLFVPEHFFKYDLEWKEYRQHMQDPSDGV